MNKETNKETDNDTGSDRSGQDIMMSAAEHPVNPKKADSLFQTLYSDKKNLLDLHKSLHPEDREITEQEITICTLRNMTVNGLYNDLSYLARSQLIILGEHQSTINWNMPLRLLVYIGLEYERLYFGQGAQFKRKQIPLARPEFYVVYTGTEPWNLPSVGDRQEIRLSDAFLGNGEPNLDLRVTVLRDQDASVPEGSTLDGYFRLIRKLQKREEIKKLTKKDLLEVIEECIAEGILTEFLTKHREEVADMLTNEFDLELYTKVVKEESVEDGLAQGLEQGLKQGLKQGREEGETRHLVSMVCKKLRKNQTASVIAEMLEEDEAYIQEICRIAEPFAPEYDENKVYEACCVHGSACFWRGCEQ